MSNREALTEAHSVREVEPPVSGMAVAALILGLLTVLPAVLAALLPSAWTPLAVIIYIVIAMVPALVAVVLGHVATGTVRRGERRGKAMAKWGVGLGYFAIFGPAVIHWALLLVGGR
jgi:MFS family permease